MHIWTSWLTYFITECHCTIKFESTWSQRFAMTVCMIELIFYSNNGYAITSLTRQKGSHNSSYLMITFDIILLCHSIIHYIWPPFKSYSLYHSLRIKRWFFTSILDISYLIIIDGNDIVITKSSLYSNILNYMSISVVLW